MTDRYEERLEKITGYLNEILQSRGRVSENAKRYLNEQLELWFPRNLPKKASRTEMKLVSEGIRIMNWEAYGEGGRYATQQLAPIISPFIPRMWSWVYLIAKTDPAGYAQAVQRDIILNIIQVVGSFANSPDLCRKMYSTPDLIEEISYMWAGRYRDYRQLTPKLVSNQGFGYSYSSEIMVFSSMTIRRLIFTPPSIGSPTPSQMKFIDALGGTDNLATIYLGHFDEVMKEKHFVLIPPKLSSTSTQPVPELDKSLEDSLCLDLLLPMLLCKPIAEALYRLMLIPKLVDYALALIDWSKVFIGPQLQMILRAINVSLCASSNQGTAQLVAALSQAPSLLSLIWKMPFDESDEEMRKMLIVLFQALCNHLIYFQAISPSLASIAGAERDHKAKIRNLPERSLLKQLWGHYTALAKEYMDLKKLWNDTKLTKCMESTYDFTTRSLTNMHVCGQCKGTYYCSRECQVKNWSAHKAICQRISASTDTQGRILYMPNRNENFFLDFIISIDIKVNYTYIHDVVYANPPVSTSPDYAVVLTLDYAEVPAVITAKWAPMPHDDPLGNAKNARDWAKYKEELDAKEGQDAWKDHSVVIFRELTKWAGTQVRLLQVNPMREEERNERGNCPCGCAESAHEMRKAFNTPVPGIGELKRGERG
ncbi:hypothetical protein BT96DRAFT_1003914 [Gymnopus androsaceus JB14]|uniref:MYND-type domain-containing protein n=1 Tax=Gymnopus androsaceus JB14 TaxID=1447944 RepID=A0A6A4GUF3_9AGAR|nr:hypothetical protein BT96DRAFT_1003914 [Gymnopus androsaceus JB14]